MICFYLLLLSASSLCNAQWTPSVNLTDAEEGSTCPVNQTICSILSPWREQQEIIYTAQRIRNERLVFLGQRASEIDARNLFQKELRAFVELVMLVLTREMSGCDILVAFDHSYANPELLDQVLVISRPKQVLRITTTGDLLSVSWESGQCKGYIIMLGDPGPLLSFGDQFIEDWDYNGRYFLALPERKDFDDFAKTLKGKKTQYLATAIQTSRAAQWTIYENQLYRNLSVHRVNTWVNGSFVENTWLSVSNFSNLQGATLKVISFEWLPSVFYHRSENGTLLYRYGIDIGVVEALAQTMNFSIRYEQPRDGKLWGWHLPNGSWNGMMGELYRNEGDMGIGVIYITMFRFAILSFTIPYDYETYLFLATKVLPLPRWQALAFPFHGTTWIAILFGLIVAGPVLYVFSWASSHSLKEVRVLQSLTTTWYYVLGMHTCESHASVPRNRSTQVFIVFLWMYTMIITIAYASNLTAFLTVDKPQKAIETIQEIADTRTEVAGIGKNSKSTADINFKVLAKLYKGYATREMIIENVLKGQSIFMANGLHLRYLVATLLTNNGSPKARLLKESFLSFNIGVALQRHSPLKKKFDQLIGRMINGGLVENFFTRSLRLANRLKWERESSKAHPEEEATAKTEENSSENLIPLSLDHLQSIFYIYCVGSFLSIIAFLIETWSCIKI